MRRYIAIAAFFSVFLDNLYLPIQLGFDFRLNYIIYLAFIIYYLITYQKIRLSVRSIVTLMILGGFLFLIPLLKGGAVSGFVKQSLLIVFNLAFSVCLLNAYRFDLRKVCKDYLTIVKVIGVVSIVQFISLKVGFLYGADFSYLGFDMGNFDFAIQKGIQAWFQEPSFLAYAIMPAVFIALSDLFGISSMLGKRNAIFILIVLVLSWSSTGILGLLIALAIVLFSKYPILKKPIYLVLMISLLPILAIVAYQVPEVKNRIDDTASLFLNDHPTIEDIDKTNLSTYALYSNYRVTKKTFSQNILLGTGLGTYEENYDRYINTVIPESPIRDRYQLNKKDANSLMLRLLVETGVLGLLFISLFLYNKRIRFETIMTVGNGYLWAFNNGILVLILLRLLRQGHYTSLGFVLFLLVFYFSKKEMNAYERTTATV